MGRSSDVAVVMAELRDRLRFETLLADLIARFVELPPGRLDSTIEDAQRRFCEDLVLDRSVLWQATEDAPEVVLVTHLYQRADDPSLVNPKTVAQPIPGDPVLQGLESFPHYKRADLKTFCPWSYGKVRQGETVRISSLGDLPEEAAPDRRFLMRYGTRSTVLVPLSAGGAWLGFLTFASLREDRAWPDSLVKRFQLIGQVFATALAQARSETRMVQLRKELYYATRVAVLGELTATIVHEINRPLAAILSNAQAARRWVSGDAPDPGELRDVLDDIIADDKRAGQILHGIRSMLQKGDAPREPVDLNGVIREVANLLEGELHGFRVWLDLELLPDLPRASGRAVELQQVVMNLMLNGIQAARACEAQDPHLRVSSRVEEGQVVVAVRDSGPGLSEEVRRRLWEPFFTTKPGGLGMGLAICRRIIEAHGGRIWGENNPDCGAGFSFSLPAGGSE
jgi:signal transduction histidine kinase